MNDIDKLDRLCCRMSMKAWDAILSNDADSLIQCLRNATRVWNIIDHMADPGDCWDVLRIRCPWAFNDPRDTNSIAFTY